jgi:hypothetical protein
MCTQRKLLGTLETFLSLIETVGNRRSVAFCQSALVPGCVDCIEKGSDCQPPAPDLVAKWWRRASGGGQSWIVSRPVLSERRYEARLSKLPAVSIVFTSLVAGRRVRRISVGGLP